MKNSPTNWSYYCRTNVGIGEAVILYRQHNYKPRLEMCATQNESLGGAYGWLPCPTGLGNGFRQVSPAICKVFWPNLTRED